MAGKSLNISLNASLGPLTKALDAAAKMMVDFASSIEKTDKKLSDSIKTSVGEMKSALSNVQSSFDNTGKAGDNAGKKAGGSLRTQLRAATLEAQKASEEFGRMSPQFIAAAQKAANLKDEMGDVGQAIDAMNPDAKFKALGGVLKGVLGGMQAAQGAMAAFGIESEDAQKTMAKLQGLMAMSQGLNALGGLKDAFGSLQTQIGAMTTGMSGFGKAMMATGIGLLIAAVALLAANWDEVMGAVDGVSASQKKSLELSEKQSAESLYQLKIIEASENIYKLQGKSEKEILAIKLDASKKSLEDLKDKTKKSDAIEKQKVASTIVNGGLVRAGLEGSLGSLGAWVSDKIFDVKATKESAKKVIDENKLALVELEGKAASFELSIRDIDKKSLEEKIKITKDKKEKTAEINKKAAEDYKKNLEKETKEHNQQLLKRWDFQLAQGKKQSEEAERLAKEKKKFDELFVPKKVQLPEMNKGGDKNEIKRYYKELAEETPGAVKQIEAMNGAVSKSFEDTALLVGESIGKMFTGDFSGETFFSSVLAIIADFAMTIGKALIAYGFAMDAFKKAISNPYVAIAAGIALIAAGHIVKQTSANFGQKKATKHAEGGIAYGNSFVNVGEYGNAHTNPEVIAPLSKLKDILAQTGGGRQKVEVYGSLYGSQLVMASSRSMANYRRINGRS